MLAQACDGFLLDVSAALLVGAAWTYRFSNCLAFKSGIRTLMRTRW
jgi:hypothetical protein